MFKKLKYRPWPVTVTLLDCNEATGDVIEKKHTFIGHFSPFTEADLKAAQQEAEARVPHQTEGNAEGRDAGVQQLPLDILLRRNAVFFGALLSGWGQEVTLDNAPLPFSKEALSDLVTGQDGLALSSALNAAISQMRFGVAPAKNSETSLSPGQNSSAGEVATSLPTT